MKKWHKHQEFINNGFPDTCPNIGKKPTENYNDRNYRSFHISDGYYGAYEIFQCKKCKAEFWANGDVYKEDED